VDCRRPFTAHAILAVSASEYIASCAPIPALEARAMVALRDAAARKVSYSKSGNITLAR